MERETKKGLGWKSGVRLDGAGLGVEVGVGLEVGQADPRRIPSNTFPHDPQDETADDKWAWAKDDPDEPAITWPLGELVMGRHDMQHTRIFNS